jgi:cysteine desulfurase/selenocysteine lyase
MFSFFTSSKNKEESSDIKNFDYLKSDTFYFDTACQTLRPIEVIQAENTYYKEHNSCGHRVKYPWGEKTDALVEECRENLLKLVNKKAKEYTVAFTLNTTFGINQILFQLNTEAFDAILSSDIEHNSVFLPSLEFSKKFNKKRILLERDEDGALIYEKKDLAKAIVLLNTTSNIHGLNLVNLKQLSKDIKEMGGILLLDSCQTFAHNPELLQDVEFDAVFGSGHKMYGPSVGFVIIKKEFLKTLQPYLIGGSTVQKVDFDSYELIQEDAQIYARIEPGLQNYAGIIGLNKAIKWKNSWKYKAVDFSDEFEKLVNNKNATEYEKELAIYLNQNLLELKNINLLNKKPSSVVSLYPTKDGFDGHKLALMLGQVGVMCRSGYHCCHYYLQKKLALPPLFRISLGLNNTKEDIDFLIQKLKILLD